MIAIRTNLYEEVAVERRRWRWKLMIRPAIGLLIAGVIALWRSEDAAVRTWQQEAGRNKAQETLLAGQLELTRQRVAMRRTEYAERDTILTYVEQRVNWATVLEGAFAAVPETVQIASLNILRTGSGHAVQLTGRGIGASPRLEADKCLLQVGHAMKAAGYPVRGRFVRLEDSDTTLDIGGTKYATADFVIEFTTEAGGHAN